MSNPHQPDGSPPPPTAGHTHEHPSEHSHEPTHEHPHEQPDEHEHSHEHRVQRGMDGRFAIVADHARLYDHGGKEVAPLRPTGGPFRYQMRQPDVPETIYATDAAALLTLLITDYPDPGLDGGFTWEAYNARIRHAQGVIVNLIAAAMMSGQLSEEQELQLQASAAHTRDLPAISVHQCRSWDHPDIPMVLIHELYEGAQSPTPPAGNVFWLRVTGPESYLQGLAALEVISVQEHPAFTQMPPAQIVLSTDPNTIP